MRLVALTLLQLQLIIYFKRFLLEKRVLIPDVRYAVDLQLSSCDLDPQVTWNGGSVFTPSP